MTVRDAAQAETVAAGAADPGASDFFMTGGTLLVDARSYVTRAADNELYEALSRGEFCYVLTSRQMGKSSLMVRTAARLRAQGAKVVPLDLTKFGQNITAEQWYDGMRDRVGRVLRLSDEIEEFWHKASSLGPLQRLIQALAEVVLPRINAPLVIFVDEIDFSRSLPFSTDEFFAAIRECYNRRTEDPLMRNLTFCLLGVASPSDLIRDTRTTPFNVGRRIELTDFTPDEARPLAEGFRGDRESAPRLLERVLYWTGGHPYLTQRLCHAVAADPAARDAAGVDAAAQTLFLSSTARTSDDNLIFVRERLRRSRVDHTSLLELYRSVLRGKAVPYHESNVLAEVLRLSGIVRVADGMLRVRNRIYSTVFDRGWIDANLPDQDRRRQRAAYYRGLARSAGIGAVVVTLISWSLIRQERLTQEKSGALIDEMNQRARAVASAKAALRSESDAKRSAADAKLAQAYAYLLVQRPLDVRRLCAEASDILRQVDGSQTPVYLALSRSEQQFPSPVFDLGGHTSWATAVAFAPDGRHAFSAGSDPPGAADHRMIVWDLFLGRVERTIRCGGRVNSAAWSADGRVVLCACENHVELIDTRSGVRQWSSAPQKSAIMAAAISADGRLAIWPADDNLVEVHDAADGKTVQTLVGHRGPVQCTAISPDGRLALTGSKDNTLRLWDVQTGHELHKETFTSDPLAVAFSPDGKRALSGGRDQTMRLWEIEPFREVYRAQHKWPVNGVAFSPKDPDVFATAGNDWIVRVWRRGTSTETYTFAGHTDPVKAVAFSPDGGMLLSASADRSVRLWALRSGQAEARTWREHVILHSAAISADGRTGAYGSHDGKVRLVDLESGRWAGLIDEGVEVDGLAFSPDGRRIALATPERALVRDLIQDKEVCEFTRHTGNVTAIAYFPDGRRCITGSLDGTIQMWDSNTGSPAGPVLRHGAPVMAVAVDPAGRRILSAGRDWKVRLWDAQTGGLLHVFADHVWWATTVAFSPDGRTAASGGADNHSFLLDLNELRTLTELPRHELGVTSVSFSPDGKYVLTASDDGQIKICDVASHGEVCAVDGRSSVKAATFTPAGASPRDGPCILSVRDDGTATAWQYGRLGLWNAIRAEAERGRRRLAGSPGDAPALAAVGRWLAFRGLPGPAATLLEQAGQGGATVPPMLLAEVYWQQGIPFRAAERFRQAQAKADPRDAAYIQLCLNALEAEMHGSPERAQRPLYDQLGGADGIRGLADDLVDRVLADPRVNFTRQRHRHTWEMNGPNVVALKERFGQFLRTQTGLDRSYGTRDMADVHAGMDITPAEFGAFLDDFRQVMNDRHLPADLQARLVRLFRFRGRDMIGR